MIVRRNNIVCLLWYEGDKSVSQSSCIPIFNSLSSSFHIITCFLPPLQLPCCTIIYITDGMDTAPVLQKALFLVSVAKNR